MKDKKNPPAAPSRKLPPWECLTKRDAGELINWTVAKVKEERDKEQAITERFIHYGQELSDPDDPATLKRALAAADNGDMTLLEIDYPEIAKRLPSHKRGRPPKTRSGDAVWDAVWDVKLIRRIWKKYFNKIKRPQNDRVNAEQIAAARWGVDVEAVCNRLKKLKQSFC
jgi:hypothetical protein